MIHANQADVAPAGRRAGRARFVAAVFGACLSIAAGAFVAGCGPGPSAANIELRKTESQLRGQVADLQRQRDGYRAQLAAASSGATTAPALSPDRLDLLFTTHGLSLGRLTGGYDADPNRPGDELLKVYAVPTDDAGDAIKAAGAFTVDLFDLAEPADTRIGHWAFDAAAARKLWFGRAMLYTYVLDCPWQRVPRHANLTVHVTFADALTGRSFSSDKAVTVQPPPATATSMPSSQ